MPRRWQRGRRAQPNCLRHAQIVCVTVRDVDFHLEHPYDAAPDAVFALLSDPEYLRARFEATGALEYEVVDCDPTPEGGYRIVTTRTVQADIPSFAKKFFKPNTAMTQTEDWDAGVGGHSSGNVADRAEGRPGLGHHDRHHPRRGGGRRFGSPHRRDHQGVGAARRRQTRTFRVRPGEEDDGPRARIRAALVERARLGLTCPPRSSCRRIPASRRKSRGRDRCSSGSGWCWSAPSARWSGGSYGRRPGASRRSSTSTSATSRRSP